MSRRSALLIRCSAADAAEVRKIAKAQRRTMSGYVLRICITAIEMDEILCARLKARAGTDGHLPLWAFQKLAAGHRSAILLRCSTGEAGRIRRAAQRRGVSLTGFVMHCIHRAWSAREEAVGGGLRDYY